MRKRKAKTADACKDNVIASVRINNLNVRKGPGKKYASLGFLTPGYYLITELDKSSGFGKLENGNWICVKGITGVELGEFSYLVGSGNDAEQGIEEVEEGD